VSVSSATSRIVYTGNNSLVTAYAVPFYFEENAHLNAIAKTAAGVETVVTLTNVTGAGDPNGGTVRTAVAVPATSTLTIYREVPATQTTSYAENDSFPAASHERALDKLTTITQQLERRITNCIRGTEATPLSPIQSPTGTQQFVLSTTVNQPPSWQELPSLAAGPVVATGTPQARFISDRFADVVNVKDFGAIGDGVSLDTTAVQAAIDFCISAGKALYVPAGVYSVGPLNFNGTGNATPANSQWTALVSLFGDGRVSSVFKARPGAYGSNQYVITARNTAGVSYRDFGVNGNGVTTRGIDFAWVGGSSGNPVLAPSNCNIFQNIAVEGCSGNSFNLDQCHDTKISGLWCRGVTPGNYAVLMNGSGGKFGASDLYISSGLIQISCQDAGFQNCGFFGGVELASVGYNVMTFDGCHVYPNTATGITINSTATGNATRGVVWTGCYFDTGAAYVVAGNYWNGMSFIGCKFQTVSTAYLSPSIAPNSGPGFPPLFQFQSCDFDSAHPVSITNVAKVSLIGCCNSIGQTFSDYGDLTSSGAINFTASSQALGFANIRSSQNLALVAGGTLTVPMAFGTWVLTVVSFQSSANNRTSTTYQVAGFNGDGFAATQLATNVGSAGNTTPFTVTWSAGNIVITNTSAATVSMTASMFGVGS
jgi:hypothetical protein